ncbi:hypothetical protein BSLA_02f4316 [Burkholderia stabilis]|nr:hypothetical protein BSLA_02f4316 [Burkholderia stabilis]
MREIQRACSGAMRAWVERFGAAPHPTLEVPGGRLSVNLQRR